MTGIDYRKKLTAKKPHKKLTKGHKQAHGRSGSGRITTRHKGGGSKKVYRLIDFKLDKHGIPAKVETIEYDPYRSAFIALVCYRDGERRYVLASKGMQVGDAIIAADDAPIAANNRLPLARLPVGTFVYNIETRPGAGAKLVRSAGNYAEVVAQDAGYTQIKLPSSEVRKVPATGWATVGEVGNEEHRLVTVGKAGRSRWMGKRPTVRGSAMNPVDHPHGGGEGRSPRGHRRQRTKWGKPAGKGQKTRTPNKYSDKQIVQRRKPGARMKQRN
jgi:large subunit ribosomal protein L2